MGVELNSGDSEPTISAALKAALKDHWGTFVGLTQCGPVALISSVWVRDLESTRNRTSTLRINN